MKRISVVFFLTWASLMSFAQYVIDLDELELLGTWSVTGSWGDDSNGSWRKLKLTYRGEFKTFEFADGNYTKITTSDGQYISDYLFNGYWITTAKTNNCFLHMKPCTGSDSFVNFIIKEFDGETMVLNTYDGKGVIMLAKDKATEVATAKRDAPANDKAYSLDGVELPTPDEAKGVVIQSGKKVMSIHR